MTKRALFSTPSQRQFFWEISEKFMTKKDLNTNQKPSFFNLLSVWQFGIEI